MSRAPRLRNCSLGLDVNYVTNEVTTRRRRARAAGHCRLRALPSVGARGARVRYERLDDEGLFGGIDQVLHGSDCHRSNTSSPTAS